MELGTIKLTSSASGALLEQGTHPVTIKDIVPSVSKNDNYPTPHTQLATTYVDADGKQFTEWGNTKGFVRYSELSETDKASGRFSASVEGYAIDKTTGDRVISMKRTEQALSIIGKLGNDAGIPLGTEFTPQDLIGKKVTIIIGPDDRGNLRVKGTRKYMEPVAF